MAFARFHITHDFPAREGKTPFEDQYIALRRKENRLYSDEQLRQLPVISNDHPHYDEWRTRQRSAGRLLKNISNLKRPLKILEVGCGNGWLANKLSIINGAAVTGFDINLVELQQARRVFGQRPNLQFTSRDPFAPGNAKEPFDLIVFAASIQYFSSLDAVVSNALQRLRANGSIHIIDSHFYKPEEVPAARQRTLEYYHSLGFPGLGHHYFHHSLNALKPFRYQVLYNPHTVWNRLVRRNDPFHWVCIKKNT